MATVKVGWLIWGFSEMFMGYFSICCIVWPLHISGWLLGIINEAIFCLIYNLVTSVKCFFYFSSFCFWHFICKKLVENSIFDSLNKNTATLFSLQPSGCRGNARQILYSSVAATAEGLFASYQHALRETPSTWSFKNDAWSLLIIDFISRKWGHNNRQRSLKILALIGDALVKIYVCIKLIQIFKLIF